MYVFGFVKVVVVRVLVRLARASSQVLVRWRAGIRGEFSRYRELGDEPAWLAERGLVVGLASECGQCQG